MSVFALAAVVKLWTDGLKLKTGPVSLAIAGLGSMAAFVVARSEMGYQECLRTGGSHAALCVFFVPEAVLDLTVQSIVLFLPLITFALACAPVAELRASRKV